MELLDLLSQESCVSNISGIYLLLILEQYQVKLAETPSRYKRAKTLFLLDHFKTLAKNSNLRLKEWVDSVGNNSSTFAYCLVLQ